MNVELLLKEYVATDTIAGEIISEKHQVKYSCTYVIKPCSSLASQTLTRSLRE